MVRRNRVSQLPVCYLLPFICSRVLFWSAVVMTIINFFHINDTLFASFIDNGNVNPDIPFISILVVAPVTLMVTYWAYKRGHNMSYCVDCIFRNGPAAERGFLGKLFSQEGQYQIRFLLFLSIIIVMKMVRSGWCLNRFKARFRLINSPWKAPPLLIRIKIHKQRCCLNFMISIL